MVNLFLSEGCSEPLKVNCQTLAVQSNVLNSNVCFNIFGLGSQKVNTFSE